MKIDHVTSSRSAMLLKVGDHRISPETKNFSLPESIVNAGTYHAWFTGGGFNKLRFNDNPITTFNSCSIRLLCEERLSQPYKPTFRRRNGPLVADPTVVHFVNYGRGNG